MQVRKEPFPVYRRMAGLNWSTFKHAAEAASWARYKAKNPPEGSAIGRATHCLALDKPAFAGEFAVSPFDSFRTKEAREWKAQRLAEGVDVISLDEFETSSMLAHRLNENPRFKSIIADALTEVSVYSSMMVGDGLVDVKCRFDILKTWPNGEVWGVDLKTCGSLTPREFCRVEARKHHYLAQGAFYSDCHGSVDRWLWCCINEKTGDVFWVVPSDEQLEAGRNIYRRALDKYVTAQRTGIWSGAVSDTEFFPAEFPEWYLEGSDGGDDE
jgi:hypothetical protein